MQPLLLLLQQIEKRQGHTKSASIPTKAAASLFIEVACIAFPILVLLINKYKDIESIKEATNGTIFVLLIDNVPNVIVPLKYRSETVLYSPPNNDNAIFAKTILNAKVNNLCDKIGPDKTLFIVTLYITQPITNINIMQNGTEIIGSSPKNEFKKKAIYIPIIKNSPWAKLSIFITPQIKDIPTATQRNN